MIEKKDILEEKEDILKNISTKITFLENKIQYLIDENAELKGKIKEESLKNEKLDRILECLNKITNTNDIKIEEKEVTFKDAIGEENEILNLGELNLEKEDHKVNEKIIPINVDEFIKEGEYYLERFYNNEDLLLAIDYLGEASDLGSAYASVKLGDIYYENEICKDINLAIEYYKRAAFGRDEKGIERLLEIYEVKGSNGEEIYYYYLGDLYFNGEIVNKDKEKYMDYYVMAAEKGILESINKLIKIYTEEGRNGDSEASYTLGEIYNYGEWVERDMEEAFDWYNKSQIDGNEEAKVKCGELAFEIAEALLAEENIMCIEWYNVASKNDNREAQYKLGTLFEKGYIVDRDGERALELYKKSAENGYLKAITKIRIIKPMQSLFNKEKEE